MSELKVNTIKKADGTGALTVPAETGTVVTTASPSLGRRNLIINGAMQVAQRGTSQSIGNGNGYVCDRYECAVQTSTGQITFSQDSDAPAGFTNSTKMVVDTANGSLSAANHCLFQQMLEGLNVAHLGWGTSDAQDVTVSFWIKGSVTGTYTYYWLDGSATSQSYVAPFTIDSANTWERKTITITAPTTGGTADFPVTNARHSYTGISLGQGSDHITATTNAWHSTANFAATTSGAVSLIGNSGATLYVTGWQIEVGSVATPFEHRSYGEELALCQRYYFRTLPTPSGEVNMIGAGVQYDAGTDKRCILEFPVRMRTKPTVNVSNPDEIKYERAGSGLGLLQGLTAARMNPDRTMIYSTSSATDDGTAGQGTMFMFTGVNAYIEAIAEL